MRAGGHDVIVFHVLDEAEVHFPFSGIVELRDPETNERIVAQAEEVGDEFRKAVSEYRSRLEEACSRSKIDYVPLDTSVQYDKALLEYLLSRRQRF